MLKQLIGLVLILFAAGAWLYMDCLNKQELGSAAQLQQGIVQARAEAKKRAEIAGIKVGYEKQILATLSVCQAAADKARADYSSLIEQIAPRKKGVAIIPQAVSNAADKILASAKAECQQVYDTSLNSGS